MSGSSPGSSDQNCPRGARVAPALRCRIHGSGEHRRAEARSEAGRRGGTPRGTALTPRPCRGRQRSEGLSPVTHSHGNRRKQKRIRQARPCRKPAPVERFAPRGGCQPTPEQLRQVPHCTSRVGTESHQQAIRHPPRARTATDEGPPPPHRGGAGDPHTPPADFTKPAHGGRPASPGRRGGGRTYVHTHT